MTLIRRDGVRQRLRAGRRGDEWFLPRPVRRGESAYVAAGDVTDYYGNVNGADSAVVQGR